MAIAASTHLSGSAPDAEATRLWLPYPEALPGRRSDVAAGVRLLLSPSSPSGALAKVGERAGRTELRKQLAAHPQEPRPVRPSTQRAGRAARRTLSRTASAGPRGPGRVSAVL